MNGVMVKMVENIGDYLSHTVQSIYIQIILASKTSEQNIATSIAGMRMCRISPTYQDKRKPLLLSNYFSESKCNISAKVIFHSCKQSMGFIFQNFKEPVLINAGSKYGITKRGFWSDFCTFHNDLLAKQDVLFCWCHPLNSINDTGMNDFL